MTTAPPRAVTPAPALTPILAGHFREGPGYAIWRPRGTEDYLLMYTLAGSGRIRGDGGEVRTLPGTAVLLRPHNTHDYGTSPIPGGGSWELVWAHFLPRPHWREWLSWPEVGWLEAGRAEAGQGIGLLSLAPGDVREAVESALLDMVRFYRSGLARRADFTLNRLETALLWLDTANPKTARLDPRVARAIEYLLENLRRPVTVAEAARAVHLSPSRFAHLFKEQTGETPRDFLEGERIRRASELLARTGRGIAVIAEEVGFESPFYFSQRFRHRTGMTPRAWRRNADAEAQMPPVPNPSGSL